MKSQLSIIEKKAISSQNLQNRLSINKKLGSKDLTKWLFSKYKIKKKEKILELGCGIGSHVVKESKIVGYRGYILAIDYSKKSLKVLQKKKGKKNNIEIKYISMDDISKYLRSKKVKFDKIISSYALYYAKNPIKVIKECSNFLNIRGKFLITAPDYPHTLIEFAKKQKTLPKEVKKQIDFSSKKLGVFLKKKKYSKKIYNFQNILKFKNLTDLINFYRSTVFYNKKSEASLTKLFLRHKRKNGFFKIVKSAKLYKFLIN